jgi:hypothetical protein
MSIRKLAELAVAGPELGTAQSTLVFKYYHIPILLCNTQTCKGLIVAHFLIVIGQIQQIASDTADQNQFSMQEMSSLLCYTNCSGLFTLEWMLGGCLETQNTVLSIDTSIQHVLGKKQHRWWHGIK